MRVRQLLLVLVLSMAGALGSANAALLGNSCTILTGCAPDFNVTGLSVGYAYNGGIGEGILTVSGSTSDASFLPGQLNPWPDASDMTLAVDPDRSILVGNATDSGNRDFLMTMTVDSSGNLLDGLISMNGKVNSFFGPGNNTNPDFQGNQLYTAAANGVDLDGALIAAGSTITAMGYLNKTLDFRAALDPNSVLSMAGFGVGGQGILGVQGLGTGSGLIEWDTSWTATSASLGLVVPLPAAFWLFLSGIAVLFSTSRSRLMRS